MDAIRQDVQYALRAARRAPVFTLSLLLTLSLALAASVTTFGVLDAVLARPLPLDAPERVYVSWTRDDARGFDHYPLPLSIVDALPERVTLIESIGAVPFFGTSDQLVEGGAEGEEVRLALVAGDLFGALGAVALSGDLPSADELEPFGERQAPLVLSHAYWRRRYAGAPVVGTTIRLEGRSYEIRAVAPEGLSYPTGVDAWAPIPASLLDTPLGGSPFLDLVVRLQPGAAPEPARVELERAVRELYSELEGFDAARHDMVVQPMMEVITGDARPWLQAVGMLVGVLLIVATLNATVLLLIRALDRARELAVRVAAGATRVRLIRQVTTENLVLASAACALALLLAAWGLDVLRAAAPPGLPRTETIRFDARVALFAAAATLVVSTALSAVIAFATWRQSPGSLLRSGAWQVGAAGARMRDGVVVGQIALTVVVLGAAGVLARSFYNLSALTSGFAAESILLAEVALPGDAYPTPAARRLAFDDIMPALSALPGVESATGLYSAPFPDGASVMVLSAEGQDATEARDNPLIDYEPVDARYFETLRPRVTRGRGIEAGDIAGAPLVVVVNQLLAQLFWPGEDALGKRLKFGAPDSEGEWRVVVGVIDDMRYRRFTDVQPAIYFHYEQGMAALAPSHAAIRAAAGAGLDVGTLRRAVAVAAPGAVVPSAPSLASLLEQPLARPRFHVLLLGVFALTALLLTAVGVYGSLGTNVRQRRRELAVRIALGALPGQLHRMVLRRATTMAAAGAAAGAIFALLALQMIGSLLYDVAPSDPATLSAVTAVMLMTACAAAWIPARSATRTDPNRVLRED